MAKYADLTLCIQSNWATSWIFFLAKYEYRSHSSRVASAATSVRNAGRFLRRCGRPQCGRVIAQAVDAPPQGAGRMPLYCGVECQQAAARRQRTLRRLLDRIDRELATPEGRSASGEQLRMWRRMAAWELTYFPKSSVDLALP